VLAESLVVVDIGVRPLIASWRGDAKGRPLGPSSEDLLASVDGRLGLGDGCGAGPIRSMPKFPSSKEGCARLSSSGTGLLLELDGRVGGEGGAPRGIGTILLGPLMGCSQRKDACGGISNESDLCIVLPRGSENFE
jgi:hypothetical protein